MFKILIKILTRTRIWPTKPNQNTAAPNAEVNVFAAMPSNVTVSASAAGKKPIKITRPTTGIKSKTAKSAYVPDIAKYFMPRSIPPAPHPKKKLTAMMTAMNPTMVNASDLLMVIAKHFF